MHHKKQQTWVSARKWIINKSSTCGGVIKSLETKIGKHIAIEEKVTENQYKVILTYHIYHMMKQFYLDGIALFYNPRGMRAHWMFQSVRMM